MVSMKLSKLLKRKDKQLQPELAEDVLSDYEKNRYLSGPSREKLLYATKVCAGLMGVMPENFETAAAAGAIYSQENTEMPLARCVVQGLYMVNEEKPAQFFSHVMPADDHMNMVLNYAADNALCMDVDGKSDLSMLECVRDFHHTMKDKVFNPHVAKPYSMQYTEEMSDLTMREWTCHMAEQSEHMWAFTEKCGRDPMNVDASMSFTDMCHRKLHAMSSFYSDCLDEYVAYSEIPDVWKEVRDYAEIEKDKAKYAEVAYANVGRILYDISSTDNFDHFSKREIEQAVHCGFYAAEYGDRSLQRMHVENAEPEMQKPKGARFVIQNSYPSKSGKGHMVQMSFANDVPKADGKYSTNVACTQLKYKDDHGKQKTNYFNYYTNDQMEKMLQAANTDGDKPVFRAEYFRTEHGVVVNTNALYHDSVPFDMEAHQYHTRNAKLNQQTMQQIEKSIDVQMGD